MADAADVIVIGAGFAGATAARELAGGGRSVLVLEARDRVGGRTWYKHGALDGLALEMGGTWIDPAHRLVHREVSRYGFTASEPWPFTLPDAWILGDRRLERALPVPAEDVPDFESFLVKLRAAAARIDPEIPLENQGLDDLDVSFDDFLDSLSLRPAVRELASVGLGSIFGDDASALNLLHRVAVVGSLTGYLASAGSQVIEGGTSTLVAAMLEDSGAELRLSTPVTAIRHDASGVVAESEGERFRARAAVVAVPLGLLAHVEFDPPLDLGKSAVSAATAAWMGAKVWAIVKDAPPGFSSLGLAHGLDYVATLDAVPGGVLTVCFGPRADEIDGADRVAVQRAVGAHLPDAEVVACTTHDWTRDPYARGGWAAYRPGQITRYGAALRRREGRLVFAGGDIAVRWPGNIEGAVESGFRAASEVAELLG